MAAATIRSHFTLASASQPASGSVSHVPWSSHLANSSTERFRVTALVDLPSEWANRPDTVKPKICLQNPRMG